MLFYASVVSEPLKLYSQHFGSERDSGSKKLSHLPVVVDPSHAAGMWWMVEPLAKAAVAVGADGLIIEVHNDPEHALCDGAQSLKPERFGRLMQDLKIIAGAVGREL